MTSPSLHVSRLHAAYRVPRDHPDAEGLRSDLTDEVARRVPGFLGAAIERVLFAEDEGSWWIRHVHLDLQLNRGLDAERLARIWAREIAASLRGALDERDPRNVVFFPSPAAHLAAFLVDTLDGVARKRWYHRDFEGLFPLPESAALRTALQRSHEDARAALALLPPRARRRLIASLTRRDAESLCRWLASGETAGAEDHWTTLHELTCRGAIRAGASREEANDRLALLVECLVLEPRCVSRSLLEAVGAIVRLERRAERLPEARSQALRRAISHGSLHELAGALTSEDLQAMLPLLSAPRTLRDTFAGGATTRGEVDAAGDAVPLPRTYTPFGGIVLLLPRLCELPVARLGLPSPGEHATCARGLACLLIGATALGAPFPTLVADPVMRTLFGLPEELSLEEVGSWWRAWCRDGGEDLRALFSEELQAADPASLRRVEVDEQALLIDGESGRWIAPAGDTSAASAEPAQAVRALEAWHSLAGERESTPADEIELAVRIFAQRALRSFAQRLPGFGRSSVGHLRANFLGAGAAARLHGRELVEVSLERPPLQLILQMAGVSRFELTLPWSGLRLSVEPAPEADA